jgi:hypothetical protein
MSNKILRGHQVLRGEDPDEPETNFSREADKASGIEDNPTRLVTGGHAYPALPTTSPWSVPADHGFHPARDRVDEPTSMVTGIDMTTLSGAPPPDEVSSLSHQAPVGEVAADSLSATSPTFSKEEEQ